MDKTTVAFPASLGGQLLLVEELLKQRCTMGAPFSGVPSVTAGVLLTAQLGTPMLPILAPLIDLSLAPTLPILPLSVIPPGLPPLLILIPQISQLQLLGHPILDLLLTTSLFLDPMDPTISLAFWL